MRASRMVDQVIERPSLFSADGLVATSGIIASVFKGGGGRHFIEMSVSNCEDWNATGLTAHLKMEGEIRNGKTPEQTLAEIESLIGGVWFDDLPTLKSDPCGLTGNPILRRSLRTASFIWVNLASRLLQRTFEKLDVSPDESDIPEVIVAYPLREMLNGPDSQVRDKYVMEDHRSLQWVRHLRTAGLSEAQIGFYGPELLYQTRHCYKPISKDATQQAIKEALRHLIHPSRISEARRAFKNQKWDWPCELGKSDAVCTENQHLQSPRNLERLFSQLSRRRAKRLEISVQALKEASIQMSSGVETRLSSPMTLQRLFELLAALPTN